VLRIRFKHLDETEFEDFCFDLLDALGFVNLDWRKGTGKKTSPADRGRDIEAYWPRVDVDETRHLDRWFVDPKHYETGVPPERLQGLLTWAEAERPHTALVIASGFLSNPAKDNLKLYEENRRPPFEIKVWERKRLEGFLEDHPQLVEKYLLAGSSLRSEDELIAAEQEFFDRIWYERHLIFRGKVESGEEERPDEIYRMALEAAERAKARRSDLRPVNDDFEWGMWNGKFFCRRIDFDPERPDLLHVENLVDHVGAHERP